VHRSHRSQCAENTTQNKYFFQTTTHTQVARLPLKFDAHSEAAPPLPIPNRTVKHLSANDSADSRVKVGQHQTNHTKPVRSTRTDYKDCQNEAIQFEPTIPKISSSANPIRLALFFNLVSPNPASSRSSNVRECMSNPLELRRRVGHVSPRKKTLHNHNATGKCSR
jgi:hypothetical protein